MRLHDLMLDELADLRADADHIVERAATSRHHRRLAWVAGGVAAALLLGVAGWALAGHGTGTHAVDPAGQGTVPASPRAVAGALASIIPANAELGDPDSWAGLDASPAGLTAIATWSRSDGTGPRVEISLGLFHEDEAGLVFGVGPEPKLSVNRLFDNACISSADECHRSALANGDLLLVSRTGGSIAVFLDSPSRDLLVGATADASSPSTLDRLGGVDALTTLVEDPRLGWQMPGSFEQTGDAISHFTEHRLDPNAIVSAPSAASGSGSAGPEPQHVTSSMMASPDAPGAGYTGGGDASGSASSPAAAAH